MALPTQEIEKLVKGPVAEQGAYHQLLLLGGALFAISAILYLGISYGYKPYLDNQVVNLQSQIDSFSKQISADEQAQLTAFYSQLANLNTLLAKHSSTANVFDWLEQNTQVNTYLIKLSYSSITNQLNLNGAARSADDIAEQAAIFESLPEVSRVNFGNVNALPTGSWQFTATIFLKPSAFISNIQAQPVAPPVALPPQTPISTSTPTSTTR